MKRLAMYLAVLLGCYGPTFGILAAQPVMPPHDMRAAFDYACATMQYDCEYLPLPQVVWHESLMTAWGTESEGGYNGTDAIHLSYAALRVADYVYIQSVLAHEATHYLDVQLGVVTLPYTKQNVCESEFNAWRVGNAYVVTHGRMDFADFGWAERYGCFQ